MGNQASSSSSITHNWTYDVLLRFYGQDTRLGSISPLYQSLHQRRFHVVFYENIGTGDKITYEFSRAIPESIIATIVYSKNYASPAIFEEELAKILELSQEKDRLICQVICLSDPLHLRGSYAEAEPLALMEEIFEDKRQKVGNSRNALSKAAGCRRIRFKPNCYGVKTISSIISYFCKSLRQSGIQGFQEDLTTFVQWVKVERIGAGGFGIVYLGFDIITGEICAIKEMLHIENLQTGRSLNQEVKILSRLEHQNIVKYYDCKIVNSQVSIYMEYIESGSLGKYIRSRGALQESLVRYFTAQILSGLVYLHSQRVVHRDIKPDNILVDSGNIAKLADFGLAKHLAQSVGNHSKFGTVCYAAPEVIWQKAYKSSGEAYAADIWSLGCVVIEMFSGMHPWSDCSRAAQVMFKVGCQNQAPEIPEDLSSAGKEFLESCFIRDPANRPSAAALLDHPFVTTQT